MAGVGISWYLVNDRLFQAASPRVEEGYRLKSMGVEAHSLKKEAKAQTAMPSVSRRSFATEDVGEDFWKNVTSNGSGAVLTPSSPEMPNNQLSLYRDPKFHVHVLTTIISTAMNVTGYVPGARAAAVALRGDPAGAAAEETQAFVNFLRKLSGYARYITTVDSANQWINNKERNCDQLISAITKFMESSKDLAAGDKKAMLTAMIDSIKSVAQALSTQKPNLQGNTCFKQFNIVGTQALNPCVGIYFCTVQMQMETTNGKGVYAQSQKFQVHRVTYELNSMSVSADSEILAAGHMTGAQELVNDINKIQHQGGKEHDDKRSEC